MARIMMIMVIALLAALFSAQGGFDNALSVEAADIVGMELPGLAGTLFGNERINLEITLNDGSTVQRGIVTENDFVVSYLLEELSEPTIEAWTDEATVNLILASSNKMDEFRAALDDGRIEYSGVGIGEKIKLGLASLVASIIGWFS